MPIHGWTVDADHFQTRATNFFDHNTIGNSNMFFPLTIDGALIQGWEVDRPIAARVVGRRVPPGVLVPARATVTAGSTAG